MSTDEAANTDTDADESADVDRDGESTLVRGGCGRGDDIAGRGLFSKFGDRTGRARGIAEFDERDARADAAAVVSMLRRPHPDVRPG